MRTTQYTEWNKLVQKWDPITLYLYCSWEFLPFLHALSLYKNKNTQHTWITNKPYRRFFALHYSSDECMPWQWAILATPTFVVRFVDFHDYCCTAVSCRIRRVFSLQVIARFVLIVGLMWPQLLGSLYIYFKRDRCSR